MRIEICTRVHYTLRSIRLNWTLTNEAIDQELTMVYDNHPCGSNDLYTKLLTYQSYFFHMAGSACNSGHRDLFFQFVTYDHQLTVLQSYLCNRGGGGGVLYLTLDALHLFP